MYNSTSCFHLFQLSAKSIASKSSGPGSLSWVILSSLLPLSCPSSADPSVVGILIGSVESLLTPCFNKWTATYHRNKTTLYFESHSTLYIHDNKASVHPSTEATQVTVHNRCYIWYLWGVMQDSLWFSLGASSSFCISLCQAFPLHRMSRLAVMWLCLSSTP